MSHFGAGRLALLIIVVFVMIMAVLVAIGTKRNGPPPKRPRRRD